MTLDSTFEVGDWIVHTSYGVGQIKKVEKRPIHGEKVRVFNVKIEDGRYWVPVEEEENPRIRHVVNKRKLKRALKTLTSKPQEMADNYKTRNAHIKSVFESGSIQKMAKLLRDLLALREKKQWNNTERSAAEKLVTRFEREYAISHEVPIEEARIEIHETIGMNI